MIELIHTPVTLTAMLRFLMDKALAILTVGESLHLHTLLFILEFGNIWVHWVNEGADEGGDDEGH